MELKDYITIIKQYLIFIILFVFVGATLGYVVGQKNTKIIKFEQSFYILPASNNQASEDPYNNYWSQEKARNFTDTALSLIQSPQFTGEFIKTHGSYNAKKSASQLIKVTISANNADSAKNIAQEIESGFNSKISQIHQTKVYDLIPLSDNLSTSITGPTVFVSTIAGLLIGLLFAVTAIGFLRYFKI